MAKKVFIAEKPSVAREFAAAIANASKSGSEVFQNKNGYMESARCIVTWCVGHLVALSYPEVYDEKYRRWSFDTIPFIPEEFRYEVIAAVKGQFAVVSALLNREDVDTIYVCTDAGREGEYIYRLVEKQANVRGKERKRVWIDSQTEEEILRGIREAKDLSAYDHLSDAAYLRAKVDYLMGINFSRALSLKYSYPIKNFLNRKKAVVSVGRVMTCVMGIVIGREWEIRGFVKTPFYKVLGRFDLSSARALSDGARTAADVSADSAVSEPCIEVEDASPCIEAEWKCAEGSLFYGTKELYKDNGFLKEEDAKKLLAYLSDAKTAQTEALEKKKEVKNPPLLYNLAELQNDCAKYFKISPDQTLAVMQELYEKKLTTYPRTDARVLSSAVAKEIGKHLTGLQKYPPVRAFAEEILSGKAHPKLSYTALAKTRYVNDKQVGDHYALIPTGQGFAALASLNGTAKQVYDLVVRRFLSIFYPAAEYQKISADIRVKTELFHTTAKTLAQEGYLKVLVYGRRSRDTEDAAAADRDASARGKGTAEENTGEGAVETGTEGEATSADKAALFAKLRKGSALSVRSFGIKSGETSPPKRFTSGTMILTMENAGQFIEDEELRAQIKGSGIGTSATRAEILHKLIKNGYLDLQKKTQTLTPTLFGELIYEVVKESISPLLNPALTASWEKGLTQVERGEITPEEYMEKLSAFIVRRTEHVKQARNQGNLQRLFARDAGYYGKRK